MRASIGIEHIGADMGIREMSPNIRRLLGKIAPVRAWVAQIVGIDPHYGYKRVFLRGKYDYTRANSVGSRGIFVFYMLESGHIYEVSDPISWKRINRYFCTVSQVGDIIQISKEEVNAWLKNGAVLSASMS